MKNLIAAAAVSVGLAFAPAQAAILDFANEADTNGERGVAPGSLITIDGFTVQLLTFTGGANSNGLPGAGGNPYLDAGNAGLGVCQVLDMNAQCAPSSDDSVQQVTTPAGAPAIEAIGLQFLSPVNVLDLVFVDGRHNPINAMNDGTVDVFLTQSSNPTFTTTFSNLVMMVTSGDPQFQMLNFIGFAFVDKAFYISSITIEEVPIPGAIPLLLSGLAGLGFASRKRKAA